MKLEGLLVDLVPYGKAFQANDHAWQNHAEANYWSTMGEIHFTSRAQIEREHQEWAESETPGTGVPSLVWIPIGTPVPGVSDSAHS